MLDQHFKSNRKNTLECKWFNTEWLPDMYFAETLHCDFPITLDNAIIMMTVVKTSNVELRSKIIRKKMDT